MEAMSKSDRVILQNAKLRWRRLMRAENHLFMKRKYRYVTIMKIEG